MFKKLLDITSRNYEWMEATSDFEFITISFTLIAKHFLYDDSRLTLRRKQIYLKTDFNFNLFVDE